MSEAVSEKRSRDQLGHDLYKLLNDTKKHFAALDLQKEFSKSVEAMVLKLHEADKAGTAFRYAGLLPDTQENVDSPDLVAMLDLEFSMLCAVTGHAEAIKAEPRTTARSAGLRPINPRAPQKAAARV